MSEALATSPAPPGRGRALTALVLLSAVVTWLAFPPVGIGAAGWLGLVPLLAALSQVSPGRGFLLGLLFGVVFMGAITSFTSALGAAPWTALALGMSLFYAVFGLIASLVCQHAPPVVRVPALAGAWTLLEILRGSAHPVAFTMGDLAYSQHAQLPIAQFAALAGHYGVSFLMALLNAGLATVLLAMFPRTWRRPGHPLLFNRQAGRVMLACYAVVFLVHTWGSLTMRVGQGLEQQKAQSGPTLTVAAVQASLPLGQRVTRGEVEESLAAYEGLSRLPQPADLIVWPETAAPTVLNQDPKTMSRLSDLARREKAHLLIGAIEGGGGRIYNSAFFLRPAGACTGTYRKLDLVIFGEYVPFRDRWEFLKRYPIRMQDFLPGQERRLFAVRDWQVAPLICYEGIFPEPTREVAGMGADIIALITSDLWALDSPERWHNSIAAPFRAIESRRYLVRAATNGLTAVYDPYGEALSEVGYGLPGAAVAKVPRVDRHPSTYQRLGHAPLVMVCALLLVIGLLTRSRAASP